MIVLYTNRQLLKCSIESLLSPTRCDETFGRQIAAIISQSEKYVIDHVTLKIKRDTKVNLNGLLTKQIQLMSILNVMNRT